MTEGKSSENNIDESSSGCRVVGLIVLAVVLALLGLIVGIIAGGITGSVGAFFTFLGIGLLLALFSLIAAGINFFK